jgi:hypothetical protein
MLGIPGLIAGRNAGRIAESALDAARRSAAGAAGEARRSARGILDDAGTTATRAARSLEETLGGAAAAAERARADTARKAEEAAAPAAVRNRLGRGIGRVVKAAVDRGTDAVGSLFDGTVGTAAGVVGNVLEGLGDVGRGLGKILTGRFVEGARQAGLGIVKAALQTPADAVLFAGGKTISAVQTLTGLEPAGRKLTAAEKDELRRVYGGALDVDRIRVKDGHSGLLTIMGRPFCLGNTLYLPPRPDGNPRTAEEEMNLLVHEAGHVWQYQNGGTDYLTEALLGQQINHYDFAKGIEEGKSWSELDPEQQAQLLQEAHAQGFFDDPAGSTFTWYGQDYTDYVRDAHEQVQAGEGAP